MARFWCSNVNFIVQSVYIMTNNTPEAEYTGVSDLRLMVVDDDPALAKLLGLLLIELGHTSVPHTDPMIAISGFDEEIDGVITDFNMPGMDGISMVRELRAKTPKPLAAILMTADSKNLRRPGISEIQGCLTKPFTLVQLTETLSHPRFQEMVLQRRGTCR